jgi:glycosyltransferase involved in cell wall biosynthesis
LNIQPIKTVLAIASQVDKCEATMLNLMTEKGINVFLLGDKEQRYAADLGEKVKIIPITFKSRLQFSSIKKIRSLIKELTPTVIHVFSARALSNTLIATIGIKCKIVAYRGTMGHLSRLDPSSWLSFLNPKIFKIICVSHAVEGYLWQQGVPKSKTVTIHKGHRISWYSKPSKLTRDDFVISQDALVISCVANIRPVKGVDYLIKAFSALDLSEEIFKNKNVCLLLIGELRDEKISKLISESPNKNKIICTGFRNDAPDVVALADIFVMPSVAREGLPKALIEAMSKKIAPIVTNVGGMPEVVVNDVHGLVVAPRDHTAIADAIKRLASSSELRKTFGEKSFNRIKEDFVVEKSTEATLNAYL